MKLYFMVVVSIIVFLASITAVQIMVSASDNLTVALGIALAVCLPVYGYFVGKHVGKELFK